MSWAGEGEGGSLVRERRRASAHFTSGWTLGRGEMALQTTRIPELSTAFPNGSQNYTVEKNCIDPNVWEALTSSQPIYMGVVTALGVVLNAFVLLVFCLHKKACTVAEIYLSNLAAADLILVSCLAFWAVNIANDFDWPFGLAMCKVVNTGIKMSAYGSIYFLVLVSLDRYVALVHPMSHGRMRRPKYAKLGCLLVWGFSLFLGIPTLVFRAVKYFPQYGVRACVLDFPSRTVMLLCDAMLICVSFIIPIAIISFCTVKIIQALSKRSIERFNGEKSEQKATTLVLVVLVAFLICWLPFHIVTILDVLIKAGVMRGCQLEAAVDICRQFFDYLAFFNSIVNPILYVIVGKNFRKKAREVCKQWPVGNATTVSTRSNTSATLRTFT
ncbi:B2 bradykinin receptor isoform X2 [Hippocampus comes]|uniref:B2 bradykinin receptor n=2 Tax=Hippocampus comes TaxID=109280 RepID=A0A3Q2YJ13_HIPCM|nr:PREDICTED: B2 bradykinin receptor-like isoform X2 [Hippocampus comes]XP_019728144.1 PREDICTED: B2 bradykinin receptor-like isoform X2 [Hippocampus comes]